VSTKPRGNGDRVITIQASSNALDEEGLEVLRDLGHRRVQPAVSRGHRQFAFELDAKRGEVVLNVLELEALGVSYVLEDARSHAERASDLCGKGEL
jgi:hypothetical protein